MNKIPVKTFPIRLGQFLKLAEIVLDGNEAKHLIQTGQVDLNGVTETRRGKQLSAGDIVTVGGDKFQVALPD